MKTTYIRLLLAFATILSAVGLESCNSKSSNPEDYVPASDVAVTNFQLKANYKVAAHLDSVFFSLDLDNGLIYNADSLPVGTDVSKLIAVITYPSTITGATITMEEGTVRNGEIDYIENPSDSIDFTGKVTLRLTAEDGKTSKSYRIKVNVHQMEPDSLCWSETAVAALPSRLSNPKNQKSLSFNSKIYTLLEESNGSYTLSSTSTPNTGEWEKKELTFPFTPDVRTFTATTDSFFLLSQEGKLYSSANGENWQSTGEEWYSITGGYEKILLGIARNGNKFEHSFYPTDSHQRYEVESDFPIAESSPMIIFTSKWGLAPMGIITGGRTSTGALTGRSWGFDGTKWGLVSNNNVPAVECGVMIPYFTYTRNTTTNVLSEHSIMLFAGGRLADNTLNREIWITYDNGVNWKKAGQNMDWPEFIPSMWRIDYAVVDTHMEASFAPEIWETMQSNRFGIKKYITYEVDGYNVSWNCPYIYLFGGCSEEGTLYDTIWKGVFNRLSFKPLM